MGRSDLERLSKEELIELVLRLQRPQKTSRTSSKPPSTDRKERRDQAKPGGAKPGQEGHSRAMSPDVDRLVDHQPDHCPCCRARLATYLKTFQTLSYERRQSAFADLFGLTLSQGGLMNLLRRAQRTFAADRDRAIAA